MSSDKFYLKLVVIEVLQRYKYSNNRLIFFAIISFKNLKNMRVSCCVP